MVPVNEFNVWFHGLVIFSVPHVALVMGLVGQEVTSEFEFHAIVAAGSQGCQVWGACCHPFFIGEYQVQGGWCAAMSVVSRGHHMLVQETIPVAFLEYCAKIGQAVRAGLKFRVDIQQVEVASN